MEKNVELDAQQLKQLLYLAAKAALKAGQYIESFDRNKIAVEQKSSGISQASQVVTQVDLACEQLIFDTLTSGCQQLELCSDIIAFLGEETSSQYSVELHPRHKTPYFWCVDPLDGTLPFIENITGYAVAIALVNHKGEAILGVVYDPVASTLYQALPNANLLLKNGQPWLPQLASQDNKQTLSLFFDRSLTKQAGFPDIIALLKQQIVSLGYKDVKVESTAGAVINAIQMLEQAPACYFKFPKKEKGGGSLWDFAATATIAQTAGAWVSNMYGKPLKLNPEDTLFMNKHGALYASNSEIAKKVKTVYQLVGASN